MSTLTDEIRVFIVKGLACYDTPSQVVRAVKETFGIEMTRQQVYNYDPDSTQPPASRWCELHTETRRAFLRDRAEIGIAHRNVRLRMLDRWAQHADENYYFERAAFFLEQAAKECGGIYERQRRAPALADSADDRSADLSSSASSAEASA